ncbi:MAG TPA: carboxypeptidase-like regulatory domain-containing protein, partial [bacterium]|nr:carboxypeptidase-like regulatory domain-containing protein [bacterium]
MRNGTRALLVLAGLTATIAAACGGGGGDGGGGGGSPTPDGNIVKVVDSAGNPLPSIAVVVNDSAGEIASTATTAADGTVTVKIPSGGSVSVLDVTADSHETLTILTPPTGITLTFHSGVTPTPLPVPTAQTTITASFTASGTVANIHWFANCYGMPIVPYSNGVASQQMEYPCPGQQAWNFFAIGYDAGNNPVSWDEHLAVPDPSPSPVPVAFNLTQTAFDTVSVGHAALPAAGSAFVDFTAIVDTAAQLKLYPISNAALSLSAAPASTSAPVPHGASSSYLAAARVAITGTAGTSIAFQQQWKVPGASLGSSYSLDPSSHAPVSIGHVNVTDPTRLVIDWTVGSGTRGAAGFAQISWVNGSDAGHHYLWFP